MATFGERLRREREARGIGLEEIAAATKISPRYLDALERDDFERLPGDVFTKGFVRAYAEHVGLVPDELVEEFERERDSRAGAAPREDGEAVLREMSRLLADREDEPATDRKSRPTQLFDTLSEGVRETLSKEIVIASAFFVPQQEFVDNTLKFVDQGVKVKILTNSLASNPGTVSHAGFKRYRKALLLAGAEVYELRPDAKPQQTPAPGDRSGSRTRRSGS